MIFFVNLVCGAEKSQAVMSAVAYGYGAVDAL